MNWEKIRKKYPKANEKFSEWQQELMKDNSFDTHFQTRDLYDFFDKNGIRLFIAPVDAGIDFKHGNILHSRRFPIWSDKTFENRVDAEYAAFEKGFELLEKKSIGKLDYNGVERIEGLL